MTDNVDFKEAKADAEYKKANSNTARAYLALCELLKQQSLYTEHRRVKHRECPGCDEWAKCTCGLKEIWERVEVIGA